MAKESCNCSAWIVLLSMLVFAISMFSLVRGFILQFNGESNAVEIIGWYFLGAVVLTISRMVNWASHSNCPVHHPHAIHR
jgi:hypothetical protein